MSERGVEHLRIERGAVARTGCGKLYVVVGLAHAAPHHGVGNDGIVTTVDAGSTSVAHTVGDDAGTVALVVDNGHLRDGSTAVHVYTARLVGGCIVCHHHTGAGELVLVVACGVVDSDGNTAAHARHATEDARAAQDHRVGGSSVVGVRTVHAHTTAIAIGGADAEGLAVGDAAVLHIATAVHIDTATVAIGHALAHKTVLKVRARYHIHTAAIGIVRTTGDIGVVGVAVLDDTALEQCRPVAAAIGFGTAAGIETVGSEEHHMIAVAVERGVPLLLGLVPCELRRRGEVAGEDGGILVDGSDRPRAVHRALVLARLRTFETAVHADSGGDLERHIQGATARRLCTLGRGVGAGCYPHLARETVVHKVVDGILYVIFRRGPRLSVIGIGSLLRHIAYLLRRCSHGYEEHQKNE